MTNQTSLDKYIDRLNRQFPDARDHVRAFRRIGCKVVYAKPRSEREYQQCWSVLVRLSTQLESTFGITRPVMIFYSPFRDIQPRAFQFAKNSILEEDDRADRNAFFVFAPDPRLGEKLDQWSSPKHTAIPLRFDSGAPEIHEKELVRAISDRLYSRNLYYESTPVTGSRFFGRDTVKRDLTADVMSHRSPLLLGLRKSGKTSLLKEVGETLRVREDPPTVFVLRDLESLPSPPSDPIGELIADLSNDLRQHGKQLKGISKLSGISSSTTPSEFRRAIDGVLQRNPETNIVIALDEIEYLVPPDQYLVRNGNLPSIAQFLGALRSLMQENQNFSFMMAGLTNWLLNEPMLYGRPNPVLSWSKPYYVRPFDREETAELLKSVGRMIGVRWDQDAIGELHLRTGGHAFLVRSLAADVAAELPMDAESRRVKRHHITSVVANWRLDNAGILQDMLDHLDRYYPTESVLMELLIHDDDEFGDWCEAEPKALANLLNLGLANELERGIIRPSEAIHELHVH